MHAQYIVLFDGVCNLCNSSVNFIIDNDPKGLFKFGALQSAEGQKMLAEYNLEADKFKSIVLIYNNKVYHKSTAALMIARRLTGLWPLLYAFIIVPPFIRHAVYDFIAKNRYKWYGKQDTCRIPTPELKERFL